MPRASWSGTISLSPRETPSSSSTCQSSTRRLLTCPLCGMITFVGGSRRGDAVYCGRACCPLSSGLIRSCRRTVP